MEFQKEKLSFTLIEMMIAVSILTVGILGVYALVPEIIKIGRENINKFLAGQLAREGMELVRNFRDSNWLAQKQWTEDLLVCNLGCEIDYNDSQFSVGTDRYLKLDNQGYYNYQTGKETKFKRKIYINQISANTLEVKVIVSWRGKGSPFLVKERLYNWK